MVNVEAQMKNLSRRTWDYLGTRSRTSLAIMASALIVVIGSVDFITGYHLSLGIFYTVPIGILAWFVSRRAGVLSALFSALVWYFVNSVFAPPELANVVLIWNSGVRFGFFSVISNLLSSLKEAYGYQRELARTDTLTGLLNGRAFMEQAQLEVLRATRNNYEVTVLYLDLDNFKAVNDSEGHAVGDLVLKSIGQSLNRVLRATDVVGRVGGDEFAILLSGSKAERVESTVIRIQESIREVARAFDPRLSVSIGGVISDGTVGIGDLIRRADQLMYESKAAEKGSFLLLDYSAMQDHSPTRAGDAAATARAD